MRSQVRFEVAQSQQDPAPHAMMSELSMGDQASKGNERDTQRRRCRRALRHARDSGSGERITYAVELAASLLHRRGRAPEVATLVGAVEAVYLRLPRKETNVRPRQLGWTGADIRAPSAGGIRLAWSTGFEALASAVSEGFDEHRVAGRSLSLERAADLALRVLDEERWRTLAGGGSDACHRPRRRRTFRRHRHLPPRGRRVSMTWAVRTVTCDIRGFAYSPARYPDRELRDRITARHGD